MVDRIGVIYVATLYGPWNLDFFRALYKPTCISPSITATQSYAIEGAIGLYPLVLLVILYSFVTLRDRGCRIIVKTWKPFHFLLSHFQNKLNLKTSLIDTFATFLLFSYMDLLLFIFLYQLQFGVQMVPIDWLCTWIPQ